MRHFDSAGVNALAPAPRVGFTCNLECQDRKSLRVEVAVISNPSFQSAIHLLDQGHMGEVNA